MREVPEFALSGWYRDPRDHRCPHDAWLESIAIAEPARGDRSEIRTTEIRLRLLGAYHDGYIEFNYAGVKKYILSTFDCTGGVGDWIEDNIVVLGGDRICHTISWSVARASEQAMWLIEADDVSYTWIPKNA